MRTPPSLTPSDSPMSSTSDLRRDRLVEPDLVQVDVQQPGARGIELILLEHGVMRGLLAVEDDVEDRVEAVLAGQHAAKLALLDGERVGVLAAAVENAGNEPVGAQPPRVGAPRLLAWLDVQLDPLAGHFGGQV